MIRGGVTAQRAIKKHRASVQAVKATGLERGQCQEGPDIDATTRYGYTVKAMRNVQKNKIFDAFMIGATLVASALVGIETGYENSTYALSFVDELIVGSFWAEIFVKFIATGPKFWRYFKSPSNIFDFGIVVAGEFGSLFGGGNAVAVLRLVRLLRVLKLVKALPKLRILVVGLIKSVSSITYILVLLLLLFYVFAVLAVIFLGKNDPLLLGDIGSAMLTLFRVSTLEGWSDIMYNGMYGCDKGYVYSTDELKKLCTSPQPNYVLSVAFFIIFIILSSMMILNLFIGVITTSMQDAKKELMAEMERDQAEKESNTDLLLARRLDELAVLLARVTEEVQQFSALENNSETSTKITLSGKDLFQNRVSEGDNMPLNDVSVDSAIQFKDLKTTKEKEATGLLEAKIKSSLDSR